MTPHRLSSRANSLKSKIATQSGGDFFVGITPLQIMHLSPAQRGFHGFELQIVSGADIGFYDLPLFVRQRFCDLTDLLFQNGAAFAQCQQMKVGILFNVR